MSSSAASDARSRDLALTGTFARDRRLATAAAVAVSLIALGATALAGYSLVDFMAGRGRTVFDWAVPSAPIGYANALAALSVLGAIASVSLAAVARSARTRLAWLSLLAVLCPTIVLTRSGGVLPTSAATARCSRPPLRRRAPKKAASCSCSSKRSGASPTTISSWLAT